MRKRNPARSKREKVASCRLPLGRPSLSFMGYEFTGPPSIDLMAAVPYDGTMQEWNPDAAAIIAKRRLEGWGYAGLGAIARLIGANLGTPDSLEDIAKL